MQITTDLVGLQTLKAESNLLNIWRYAACVVLAVITQRRSAVGQQGILLITRLRSEVRQSSSPGKLTEDLRAPRRTHV